MVHETLHIVIFDGSFKTTPFIRRLVEGLVTANHKVTIIGFNDNNPNPISKVTYQNLGSNTSKIKLIQTSLQLAFGTKKIRCLAHTVKSIVQGNRYELQKRNLDIVLQKIKPDVVHVQWPSLLPWMEPYMPNNRFKVVLSQRGFHTNVRPFVDKANFDYLQKWYPKLDALHSVSRAISKIGKKIGKPHTGIEKVVYTGFPLKTLHLKPQKIKKDDSIRLLSVGRSHWIKDYPSALKACALLKKKGVAFHYTIIGAAENEEVLFLLHQYDLQDSVTVTNRLPQDEVYQQMQTTDILLLTSIAEGMPNVAVEAMALGLPVISTKCGGMDELITNGKTGWLVPVRSPQSIVKAILNIQRTSFSELNHIIKTARKKIEQQHTIKKMTTEMINLYDVIQ